MAQTVKDAFEKFGDHVCQGEHCWYEYPDSVLLNLADIKESVKAIKNQGRCDYHRFVSLNASEFSQDNECALMTIKYSR